MNKMSEDRNFRNCYYTKIDQKKSLDILLREKPPDLLLKVSQLTSRHGLSINRRKQVWQLLLDVVKADNRIAENRIQIQRTIVENILSSLRLIGDVKIDFNPFENGLSVENLIGDYSNIMILIFLFQSKELQISYQKQLNDQIIQDYHSIAQVFIHEFMIATPACFADTYWLFHNFILNIELYSSVILETYDKFIHYLHDHEIELFEHLLKSGIVFELPKSFKVQGQHHHQQQQQQIGNHHHFQHHSSQYHHQHLQNVQQHLVSPLISPLSQNLSPNSSFHSQPFTPNSGMKQISKHSKIHLKTSNDWKDKFAIRRPLITWFVRFFSGFIHQNFIIRIFDKIICCFVHEAKTFHVLFSIAKSLISHTKKDLLNCTSVDQITETLFKPLSLEESERIVDKSLAT